MINATARFLLVGFVLVALFAGVAGATDVRVVPLSGQEAQQLADLRASEILVQCALSYYYLLEGCEYVTVLGSIGNGDTYGVHFDMTDVVPWSTPCDTSACITLDTIELVLYDVLAPPADQNLNLKIYASNVAGEPYGTILANRDFEPLYTDSATFTTVVVDLTGGGVVQGLDLSVCGGNFVVLLTWMNSTGHPLLVLDNVGTCAGRCGSEPACCQMGISPYTYPRMTGRTAYYGTGPGWSVGGAVADPGGAGPYGYLEAFWKASFCKWSTATVPTSWGAIKASYR